jgi:hypothetical protein
MSSLTTSLCFQLRSTKSRGDDGMGEDKVEPIVYLLLLLVCEVSVLAKSRLDIKRVQTPHKQERLGCRRSNPFLSTCTKAVPRHDKCLRLH